MPQNTPGRERLTAIAQGGAALPAPVSFWRHFYTEENDARSLAMATLTFHRQFEWDWIKLNPRASYHLEDWGYLFEPSRDPLKKPSAKFFPVQNIEDWDKIEPKDPLTGVLAEHLDAIRMVVAGAGGAPVLMTVFTPLSIAGDLVPDDQMLLRHLRERPDKVEHALEAITSTFERFAVEALNAGADGLFFATTQWASRRLLSDDDYGRWGRPFDLRVLEAAREAPLNLLHVCQADSYLRELSDYPVALLNWGFEDPGNPGLEDGARELDRAVIGGVSRRADLLDGTSESIYEKVAGLARRMAGRPWGCGPDCSIYPDSKIENLHAVRRALQETGPGEGI